MAFCPQLCLAMLNGKQTKLMRRLHLGCNRVARQIMSTYSKVSGEIMMWRSDLCAAHVCVLCAD